MGSAESKYENPLVTVITPSFNQGKYIKETIESVLNQDYKNIEYWVIDGGSTDNTVDILKSYGERIHWVSEKDKGQTDAINKGILKAKGTIIGWLNSDDTYLEGAVSRAVRYIKENPETDMVYGEGYFIDEEGEIISRYYTEEFDKKRLAELCYICQPTAFMKKDILEQVGLLDDTLDLCMDYDLWMKIAKTGRIAYTPSYQATSRLYMENKTLSRRLEVHREVCDTVYKHYGYVPLTWVYGYVLERMCQKKNGQFYIELFYWFRQYNGKNICLSLESLICVLGREVRTRIFRKKRYSYPDLNGRK